MISVFAKLLSIIEDICYVLYMSNELPKTKATRIKKGPDGIHVCENDHRLEDKNLLMTGKQPRCRLCYNRYHRARRRVGNPKFDGMLPKDYLVPKVEPRPVIVCKDCGQRGRVKSDFIVRSNIDYMGRDQCSVCHFNSRKGMYTSKRIGNSKPEAGH